MHKIDIPLSVESSIHSDIVSLIDNLPENSLNTLKELVESVVDVAKTGVSDVTLQRVVQRMFVRSVNEFFTAEHTSMQMTGDRLQRFSPSAHPNKIDLPFVDECNDIPFNEVINRRRSVRDYVSTPMPIDKFSHVLKYSFGKNGSEDGYGVRDLPLYPYPSMGGLSSFDVGVVVQNIEGIPRGYYRYDQVGHALEPIINGDMRLALQDVTFESEWLMYAPFVVILAHDANSFLWKYHTRGYRISHIDMGAAVQSLYLVANSAGLGVCAVAGFLDESINALLGYDGLDKYVSIVIGVGEPAIPLLSREP